MAPEGFNPYLAEIMKNTTIKKDAPMEVSVVTHTDGRETSRRSQTISDFDRERALSPLETREDIQTFNDLISGTAATNAAIRTPLRELREARVDRAMVRELEKIYIVSPELLNPEQRALVADSQEIREKIVWLEENFPLLANQLLDVEKEITSLRTDEGDKNLATTAKVAYLTELQDSGQEALVYPESTKDAYKFLGAEPGTEGLVQKLRSEIEAAKAQRIATRGAPETAAPGITPLGSEDISKPVRPIDVDLGDWDGELKPKPADEIPLDWKAKDAPSPQPRAHGLERVVPSDIDAPNLTINPADLRPTWRPPGQRV